MDRRARWAPWLALGALSDPRFVPVALAGTFGVLALRAVVEPFGDQDVGWIAAAGRQILATGSVPHVNGWSITDAAVPWVMHEWALGPLEALALRTLGLAGATASGVVAAALTCTLLVDLTVARARNLGAGALACFLALVLTRECLFQPRPAYLCLALPLLMVRLALDQRFSPGRALACVALEAAWANAHGSFPVGIAVLVLGLSRADERRWRALAAGGALLATLATPYGTSLWGLVARYVGGGDPGADALHAHIAEFQPLWAAGPVFGGPFRIAAVVLVALGALAGLRGPRVARLDAAMALALVGLALAQSRHVPQVATLGTVLVLPSLDRLVDRSGIVARGLGVAVAQRTHASVMALALGAVSAACLVGVHADEALGGDVLPGLAADPRVTGRGAYVPFDAAGRFLWLAGEGTRIFFDPRNDCYRAETALAAYAIEEGDCTGACVETTLVGAGVEVAIVPDGHGAADALARGDAFTAVRSEGGWTLYERAGDP